MAHQEDGEGRFGASVRESSASGATLCSLVAPSINDYALLGDCQGAALVSRSGSIDWCCAPRFDSRSCFARLLDPAAGHWSIRPDGAFTTERAYAPDTIVLRTTFRTPDGDVRLSDALAFAPGARTHAIGLDSPHVLVRVVEGLSVGLLAEELGAGAGELVGNFPQAFSHVGLIKAAWAIGQAER